MVLDDQHFMQLALKLAQQAAEEDEVPVGAVVVADGQVIGKGYNQSVKLNDCTAHAEILALSAAFQALNSTILKECTLYVTVEPCAMCAGALKWAQIGRLVYGASEPKSGFTLHQPSLLHPKTTVLKGLMANESAQLMKEFFKSKRG